MTGHACGKWSARFVEGHAKLQFAHRHVKQTLDTLLEQYRFFAARIVRQTRALREPAVGGRYEDCELCTSAFRR